MTSPDLFHKIDDYFVKKDLILQIPPKPAEEGPGIPEVFLMVNLPMSARWVQGSSSFVRYGRKRSRTFG